MRKWIDVISEAYLASLPSGNDTCEVFENPSRKEVMKLIRDARFGIVRGLLNLADEDEDLLLVWSANGDAEMIEHDDVQRNILKGEADVRMFLHANKIVVYRDDIDFLKDKGIDDGIDRVKQHPLIRRIYGSDVLVEPDY